MCAEIAGALGNPAQRGGSQRAGHPWFPPLLPGAAEVSGCAGARPREPRACGTRSAEARTWGCVLRVLRSARLRSVSVFGEGGRRPAHVAMKAWLNTSLREPQV